MWRRRYVEKDRAQILDLDREMGHTGPISPGRVDPTQIGCLLKEEKWAQVEV
jgi:hypothetical protein